MASTIYATFVTEGDAERASGALMDHGVKAEDISFVLPEGVFPTASESSRPAARTHSVEAAAPDPVPLPGTYTPSGVTMPPPPRFQNPLTPEARRLAEAEAVSLQPGYRYDALGAVIPDSVSGKPASRAATLSPDTPLEILDQETRPHIINMHHSRSDAAEGISVSTAGDAVKGAAGGAGIGIGLGILLGLAAVLIPGVGLVAGAGALVAGLAAATGAAGGVAGGVFGYLTDLGMPHDSARLISDHIQTGRPLLSITVSGELSEAEIVSLLVKYGATSAQAF